MRRRGLPIPLLVISDGAPGVIRGIEECGAGVQTRSSGSRTGYWGAGERGGSCRVLNRQPPPELVAPQSRGWSASQKTNFRGTIASSAGSMFF